MFSCKFCKVCVYGFRLSLCLAGMTCRLLCVIVHRKMHETDFSHEHVETAAERAAITRTIWDQDNVSFKTVGIDIGSSTSHLLFAKVALQRQSQGLSSRFVVVGREIVWRSPILLTPFLPDGTIDAEKLGAFIRSCYGDAGFTQDEIDSGAIVGLCAFAVGGRLIAADADGAWTRIDQSARLVADDLGLNISPPALADESVRRRIAQRLAVVAADVIGGAVLDPLGQSL